MAEEPKRKWHFDLTVPLSLVVTIIVQTGFVIWWASNLSATVAELRLIDQRHEAAINSLSSAKENTTNRVTSLETSVAAIISNLDRIESKLDRLIEERRN